MNYTVAHPTKYKHTLFRSRLEARRAAFFDLISWEWEYEPVDFEGCTPDFRVHQPSAYTGEGQECCIPTYDDDFSGSTFLVEVKPYDNLEQFAGHAAAEIVQGELKPRAGCGLFGNKPQVVAWSIEYSAEDKKEFARLLSRSGLSWQMEVWESLHLTGRGFYDFNTQEDEKLVGELWAEAGNATRYQPRGY
jgi:hypothetical protein